MRADELHTEREALIAEIYVAFRDVTREGGVSWSETGVLDDYGTEAERLAARDTDREWGWTELVDDSKWQPDTGWGGFSFLDAIGTRYYLPAALVRSVRLGRDVGIAFHIDFSPPASGSLASSVINDFDLVAYRTEQLSLLDDRQRRCVARFVRFMLDWSRFVEDGFELKKWQRSWDAYWSKLA